MIYEGPSSGRQETEAEKRERETIDDVALRASEDPIFIELVGEAATKLEALKKVRMHMAKRYPEVNEIELSHPELVQGMPEFKVSKAVVDILWQS